MSGKTWLLASVGMNVALAAGWLYSSRPEKTLSTPETSSATTNTNPFPIGPQVRVVFRQKPFNWQEVESADYATYIDNLRAIGCPDTTIRDIIVADVNALFSHRRLTEVNSAEHQWWKSDPDVAVLQKASDQLRALENERLALLTRLLGAGWETNVAATSATFPFGISLTGPVLGELSDSARQKVYDISSRTQLKVEGLSNEARQLGVEPSPVELARVRQQSRAELAQVLTPGQLEEFLLRYSQTAQQLRDQTRGLELKPEEFRALFRARDPLDTQLELLSPDDPAQAPARQALESQRTQATQAAMGPERFQIYSNNLDPAYQEARHTADALGAPPQTVAPLYQVRRETLREQLRITNDPNLSEEQKLEALNLTQEEHHKAVEKILGPKLLQKYRDLHP